MNVLIADQQSKVRFALSVFFQKQTGWQIIGCAHSASELLEKLAGGLQPDIVLLDWDLPGMKQADLFLSLRARAYPRAMIVMSANFEARQQALELGADGFVWKVDSPARLMEVMRNSVTHLACFQRGEGCSA